MTGILDRVSGVVVACLVSIISLLLLAACVYWLSVPTDTIRIGVGSIYVLSAFVGGLVAAKKEKHKGYLWGLATGFCYFLLLFLLSKVLHNPYDAEESSVLRPFLLCIAGGMLGGMIG